MNTDALISVVVPIYNVEKFLYRCIMSVICQNYSNLEIILVDDGSTDGCSQICDELADKDERIKVIHKPNGGLSSARNAGISAATGEYIMLVDSDDYIDSRMARYLLELILKDHTDLAICSFQYVDESGNETRKDLMAYCPLKNGILNNVELLGLINTNVSGYWFYSVAWNKLYKADILKKIKHPENRVFEDEFVIHRLFDSIDRASVSDKCLYMYTQRTGSLTNTIDYTSLKKMDFLYALQDRYRFFKARGYDKYAYDTADLMYTVFIKITDGAFKRKKDFFTYLAEMLKISLVLLRELSIKGIKLPLVYFRRFWRVL